MRALVVLIVVGIVFFSGLQAGLPEAIGRAVITLALVLIVLAVFGRKPKNDE